MLSCACLTKSYQQTVVSALKYAQVHENDQPRNSMEERILGTICLGLIENVQGGYKFMSLHTGKMIQQYVFTLIPMPQEVID